MLLLAADTKRMNTTANTATLESIAADYEFSQDNPEEFLGYDGRVAQTKILRTVAALNPEATRKEFLEAMVGLGVNRNTAAIQFNQSRKLSVSMGDVSLMADGSLIEV